MPEPLLAVLKLLALALLYLFFLRVVRAVWAELRPPPPAPTPSPAAPAPARQRADRAAPAPKKRRGGGHLVIVEPPEQRGRSFDLDSELTVGRAPGCQVALDDSYVSQLHARVFSRDGSVWVEDLGSTNGTFVNAQQVSSPVAVKRGDQLKVGSTVMELKR